MDDEPDLFDQLVTEGATRPARLVVDDGVAVSTRQVLPIAPAEHPSVVIVPFPLAARVGKVRDVASKLAATKSDRHAEFYRRQIDEALKVNLRCKHVPAALWPGEIVRFWSAVNLELARRQARPNPGAA